MSSSFTRHCHACGIVHFILRAAWAWSFFILVYMHSRALGEKNCVLPLQAYFAFKLTILSQRATVYGNKIRLCLKMKKNKTPWMAASTYFGCVWAANITAAVQSVKAWLIAVLPACTGAGKAIAALGSLTACSRRVLFYVWSHEASGNEQRISHRLKRFE